MAWIKKTETMGHMKLPISLYRSQFDLPRVVLSRQDMEN